MTTWWSSCGDKTFLQSAFSCDVMGTAFRPPVLGCFADVDSLWVSFLELSMSWGLPSLKGAAERSKVKRSIQYKCRTVQICIKQNFMILVLYQNICQFCVITSSTLQKISPILSLYRRETIYETIYHTHEIYIIPGQNWPVIHMMFLFWPVIHMMFFFFLFLFKRLGSNLQRNSNINMNPLPFIACVQNKYIWMDTYNIPKSLGMLHVSLFLWNNKE